MPRDHESRKQKQFFFFLKGYMPTKFVIKCAIIHTIKKLPTNESFVPDGPRKVKYNRQPSKSMYFSLKNWIFVANLGIH